MKRVTDPEKRILTTASLSLVFNTVYAVTNLVLGIYQYSYWFITAGAYYAVLAIMRFIVIINERKDEFIVRFSGIMLLFMSFVLSCSVYLSIKYDVVRRQHEIVMITIALYAFTKVTLAIINMIKVKKFSSPVLTTLRSISLADGAVSIFSLQKSMLVTFDGMTDENIRLMNILTGTGTWLFVLVMSAIMIIKSKKEK